MRSAMIQGEGAEDANKDGERRDGEKERESERENGRARREEREEEIEIEDRQKPAALTNSDTSRPFHQSPIRSATRGRVGAVVAIKPAKRSVALMTKHISVTSPALTTVRR